MRVALRLAHGWSQARVAQLWNERWPGQEGRAHVTDKTISYWETWPQSGHQPSLRTLKRLAQLYHCDVGDLIDDGKDGDLDEMRQGRAARHLPPVQPRPCCPHRRIQPSFLIRSRRWACCSAAPRPPGWPGRGWRLWTSSCNSLVSRLAHHYSGRLFTNTWSNSWQHGQTR